MSSEDLNIESENLTVDDSRVGEMLRGLKRVEAPADFGVKVNDSIANAGTKKESGLWFWPAPAYIIPLALIVVAGSFFIFMGFGSADTQVVPEVASGSNAKPPADKPDTPIAPALSPMEKSNAEVAVNGTDVASDPKNTSIITKRGLNLERMHGGGSVDSSSEGIKPLMPPGFDANNERRVKPGDAVNLSPIPISDFLSALGIGSEFEGEALRVTSVKQGGIADRSGIKAGDIIESLADKKITPATVFRGRIEARAITINRGGRQIVIKLVG